MVEHKIAYGIAGATCSNIDELAPVFIDFHMVVPGGAAPTTNSWFVTQCNNKKRSPIFNNGNDGKSGCFGWDPDQYYATVASTGWHAAGGESEPNYEWKAIMRHLVGMDYGGEWNCCTDLSNIWVHQMTGENVSGKGMSAALETYVGVCGVWLCPAEVVKAAKACKEHGVTEIGIMIGGWMINHGVGVQKYIDLIRAIEKEGVIVKLVVLWWGHNTDMNATYRLNKSIIDGLQAIWPPDMRTLKDRFAPAAPTLSTTTSLSADKITPQINEDVTFTAQLKADKGSLANKPLTVYHYLNNFKYTDVSKNTDANGKISFIQKFGSAAARTYYAEYYGDLQYKPSSSTALIINVKPKPLVATLLTLSVDNLQPELHQEVTFKVTLTDGNLMPLKDKRITVTHVIGPGGGATYTDAVLITDATGEATFKQMFGSGYCERLYKATFSGDLLYAPSKFDLTVYVTHTEGV